MDVNKYIPRIYKDDVKNAMVAVSQSLKNIEKPEGSTLQKLGKMGVFITSFHYLQKIATVNKSFVTSIGLTLLSSEVFEIINLFKKLNKIDVAVGKVNRLRREYDFAKGEFDAKNNDPMDNKEAITKHLRDVNAIILDSRKIVMNEEIKVVGYLALRIIAICGLLFVGIGLTPLILSEMSPYRIGYHNYLEARSALVTVKPLLITGGVIYFAAQAILKITDIMSSSTKAIKNVDSKISEMSKMMESAKVIVDKKTGHYKPKYDDTKENLDYYKFLYKLQKEIKKPLFNDDFGDSDIIIDENIKYFQRDWAKKNERNYATAY